MHSKEHRLRSRAKVDLSDSLHGDLKNVECDLSFNKIGSPEFGDNLYHSWLKLVHCVMKKIQKTFLLFYHLSP